MTLEDLSEAMDISQFITLSHSESIVTGQSAVGGPGHNFGEIELCYATGPTQGNYMIGGLVGRNYGNPSTCKILYCYSTGVVSGQSNIGGLVGRNEGTINESYASGTVGGASAVGGLVGFFEFGEITSCYSVSTVSGSSLVGGLVGDGYGTVTSCFWNYETSNQETSDGGFGLTTSQMMTQSTYTGSGWDFTTVWEMIERRRIP